MSENMSFKREGLPEGVEADMSGALIEFKRTAGGVISPPERVRVRGGDFLFEGNAVSDANIKALRSSADFEVTKTLREPDGKRHDVSTANGPKAVVGPAELALHRVALDDFGGFEIQLKEKARELGQLLIASFRNRVLNNEDFWREVSAPGGMLTSLEGAYHFFTLDQAWMSSLRLGVDRAKLRDFEGEDRLQLFKRNMFLELTFNLAFKEAKKILDQELKDALKSHGFEGTGLVLVADFSSREGICLFLKKAVDEGRFVLGLAGLESQVYLSSRYHHIDPFRLQLENWLRPHFSRLNEKLEFTSP